MLRRFLIAFFAVPIMLHGQAANSPAASDPGPVIAELSPPYYPPLAREAHVSGDVLIALTVRSDGSVEEGTVVSGHPWLRQIALESAQKSRYACPNCNSYPATLQLKYRFELGETIGCSGGPDLPKDGKLERPYPQVTHTGNLISIYERPIGTCDMEVSTMKTRARSIRCLYLWKCAWR